MVDFCKQYVNVIHLIIEIPLKYVFNLKKVRINAENLYKCVSKYSLGIRIFV